MASGESGTGGEQRNDAGSWTTVLALVAQLGFSIACPMVVFIGGGAWLDNQLGWTPWLLLVGIFLGVATAGGVFYQIATLPTRKSPSRGVGKPKAPYKVEQDRELPDRELTEPRGGRTQENGH